MRIIGTAGHVDHGKTLLIQAMTGIDADRLPEEKARGMTTDLGFAWYPDSLGRPVGVVDVPGHERYLRNMVAGAFGVDLAVLVVAADDGWMPQTALHASILACLGVKAMVLAVNKADAVSAERVQEVSVDAAAKLSAIAGVDAPIVVVSGKTGMGIQELKERVELELDKLPEAEPSGPWLYVDRVFPPKSGGLVLTGSLRSGSLGQGDGLCLYPGKHAVKVRAVHSYGSETGRARAASRVAIAIAKPPTDPERGILAADPSLPVLSGRNFLCRMETSPGSLGSAPERLKPGSGVEVAMGSARSDALFYPSRAGGWARLSCHDELACLPGMRVALLRKGGAQLLAAARIIALTDKDRLARKAQDAYLAAVASCAGRLSRAGFRGSHAAAERFALLAHQAGHCPAWPGLDRDLAKAAGLSWAESDGGAAFAFTKNAYDAASAAIIKRAAEARPMGLSDAVSSSGLSAKACEALLLELEKTSRLRRDGQSWKALGIHQPSMDAKTAAVLSDLRRAGKAGLEPGKTCPGDYARALKDLCSLNLAMPLAGGIFIAMETWTSCVEAILSGLPAGGRFSVPQAKERSGLSRKYILPLLNKMEDKGYVKRDGDERVVLARKTRAAPPD